MALQTPNLTDLLNEGSLTKTLVDIINDLFHGGGKAAGDILLHGLSGQLDEAAGTQGGKSLGRAVCENIDNTLEASAGTVEQRQAVAQGLADNAAKALLNAAALIQQYPARQAAVVQAKQGKDAATLKAARTARNAATDNIKAACADVVRASAGAPTVAQPAG